MTTDSMNNTNLIDIGANLTHSSFEEDLEKVLQRAQEEGVGTIVVTGTDEPCSEAALELAKRYPDVLYATAGVHPHEAKTFTPATCSALKAIAEHAAVVAIGETGLDFNRNYSPAESQQFAFERQLELAAELGLPVFVHERDAHKRMFEMLKDYRDQLVDVVIVAQLHAMIGANHSHNLPAFDKVPAYRRLGELELTASRSLTLLTEARARVNEVQELLSIG